MNHPDGYFNEKGGMIRFPEKRVTLLKSPTRLKPNKNST